MKQKPVYQYDTAGLFVGETMADESPLEEDVWVLPGRTTEIAPPPGPWIDGKWPRFNGRDWDLTGVKNPVREAAETALSKLQDFLKANPDVAALLG